MRVAKARANVTAQQLVVCVCVYREKRFVRKGNESKEKIFRVYVVEKRTAKGAPRIFFKNRVLWDKKTTHETTETHRAYSKHLKLSVLLLAAAARCCYYLCTREEPEENKT